MKAYTIFDDFPESAVTLLKNAGIGVTVPPFGYERPDEEGLKKLIEGYDILIIGTGQKMTESVFEKVSGLRIIGTASIGIDHIHIPEKKKGFINIVNAPISNRISVAEHTFSLALALEKRLFDAISVSEIGLKKKEMLFQPSDLFGKTIGVVGAGGTAGAVLRMAQTFEMNCLCWTPHPENHMDLKEVEFVALDDLLAYSDVISVNIPLTNETKGLINEKKISLMKSDAVFLSLSRPEITDNKSLFERAKNDPMFCVGLDIDAEAVCGMWNTNMKNVIVTPHIGGGTIQSRIRLFEEVSRNIVNLLYYV